MLSMQVAAFRVSSRNSENTNIATAAKRSSSVDQDDENHPQKKLRIVWEKAVVDARETNVVDHSAKLDKALFKDAF
jgi:hypothetical protein